MSNIALITAAGSGNRMNCSTPKQFLLVNGRSLLSYTVEAFDSHPLIDEIAIITNKEYISETKEIVKNFKKVKYIFEGGETRQQSVFLGLKGLKDNGVKDKDIILIHDGARPLVNSQIIEDNIRVCQQFDASETVINATDTIIDSKDGLTNHATLNRKELYQVQTPQTFRFSLIYEAHQKYENDDATDDAQLVKRLGKDVHLVTGDKFNFKVTTKEDLKLFELINKN